jgi:oligoribonuclease
VTTVTTMSDEVAERLVFTDLETLGLENHSLIAEIAMVICTADLQILSTRTQVVARTGATWDLYASDYASAMHEKSGLKAESIALAVSLKLDVDVIDEGMFDPMLAAAEAGFIGWLGEYGYKKGEAVIAGNSIGQDRIWIATQMPELHEFLHYRTIDVSAIRGLIQRWAFPGYAGPQGDASHRALDDALWSRDELALYRGALFGERAAEIRAALTSHR